MDHKEVKLSIRTHGQVVVNDAILYAEGETVCAISIDLKSKYAEIFSLGCDEHCPEIILEATDRTIHTTKSESEFTTIRILNYEGWQVYTATVSRYTLMVCLTKH